MTEMTVDRAYNWTSGAACALTFECNGCALPLEGTEEHRRVDTHTIVNGQQIGRTYFFHLDCAPQWADR